MLFLQEIMETYNIVDLVPLESKPRSDSLTFFTRLWQTQRNLDGLSEGGPVVSHVNGKTILEGGNQRATWLALNGFTTIEAEKIDIPPDHQKLREEVAAEHATQGIHSPYDLAAKVKRPEQYMVINQETPSQAEDSTLQQYSPTFSL